MGFTRVGSNLTRKYQTKLERLGINIHSSLLDSLVNYDCKSFTTLVQVVCQSHGLSKICSYSAQNFLQNGPKFDKKFPFILPSLCPNVATISYKKQTRKDKCYSIGTFYCTRVAFDKIYHQLFHFQHILTQFWPFRYIVQNYNHCGYIVDFSLGTSVWLKSLIIQYINSGTIVNFSNLCVVKCTVVKDVG